MSLILLNLKTSGMLATLFHNPSQDIREKFTKSSSKIEFYFPMESSTTDLLQFFIALDRFSFF